MAGSLTSDSSKTLSATSLMSPNTNSLISTLSSAPHEFLKPSTPTLQDAALKLAKQYLDPLLAGNKNAGLGTVYLEGFDVDQVWEQVRGVVEEVGEKFKPEEKMITDGGVETDSGTGTDEEESDEEMQDVDSEGESEEGEGVELGSDDEEEEDEEEEGEEGDETLGDMEEEEDYELQPGDELTDGEEDGAGSDGEAKELVEDVHGLNDGFFSIDDFNRQTELLELADARGDAAEEDDDIDYHADPTTLRDEDDDEGSDADDAALDAALKNATNGKGDDYEEDSDDDMEMDGDMEESNANGIMYADFFAPPAKKRSGKPRKEKDAWKRTAAEPRNPEEEFERVQADMDRVRRDLFDDEDEEDDEDVDMDGDSADPLSRRSTHEKRQAQLLEQIRQLEQQNVAKREWVLAGEAKARDRPQNSLLEQDLDFERSGKPVPVITAEVTETLEEMIKRRIIAGQFDEVIKRQPGDRLPEFRRGRVELDDSKPQQSLAEIYEKEFTAAKTGEGVKTAEEEKLEKEHAEIAALFSEVNRKLDALTSWHYTPKPPAPTLNIVTDAPAIAMEEAQPTAAAGGNAAHVSMLAPQEIYNPAKDKAQKVEGQEGREIVGRSGAPVSTREMTSEDRKRRRRREKQKIRKRNMESGVHRGEVKEGSKKDVVDSLRRGGVTVVGKEGEQRDVDGRVKGGVREVKGAFLKL